jgi:hypothetical protein
VPFRVVCIRTSSWLLALNQAVDPTATMSW